MISDAIERIVKKSIGCAIEVHRNMGPGLLESVYRECLRIELIAASLQVEADARAPLVYKGRRLRSTLKIDLLVEGSVVVELKAIEQIHPIHLAQVITYLKLSDCPVGLLMNFNAMTCEPDCGGWSTLICTKRKDLPPHNLRTFHLSDRLIV